MTNAEFEDLIVVLEYVGVALGLVSLASILIFACYMC